MRFLVMGAGMMGRAVAFDLGRSPEVDGVLVVDTDRHNAEEARVFAASSKVRSAQLDVVDHGRLVEAMGGHDVAVSCVPYRFNHDLAVAAVEAGCSYCDLGGNIDTVRRELGLDMAARAAEVTVVPDCGLAPGMTNVLAADALGRFDGMEELRIRVGGLPVHPRPPLGYMLLFNPAGLVNEYRERAQVIRDGRIDWVEPLEDLEELEFPEPFGRLEAFNTSGGTSTLPETMLGHVRSLDYKTIRYPGHCEQVRVLRDLGLFDETPVQLDGGEAVPRALLEALLRERLPLEGEDAVLVRVTASGMSGGRQRTLTYTIIDRADASTGLSAMMRTTAFPASIIAQMIANGEISHKGAVPQELVVPPGRFLEEMARRGVQVAMDWDT